MQNSRLPWWQLYLLLPVMIGLILLEGFVPLPGVSVEIVDIGLVLLIFGAMLLWVHVNAVALESYYIEKDGLLDGIRVTVYEPQAETGHANAPCNEAANENVTPKVHPVGWLAEREDRAPWSLN